jgi:aspartate aminotransferase
MPKISIKGTNMPESPIRKLVPYAEKAKAKGIKVYHLNIGQPDIDSPSLALKAIRNFDANILEYSHSAGVESYRKKLVEYYAKNDIHVGIDDILVTTGGSEALLMTFMVCLEEGDEILVPEPFYANINSFAIAANVNIKPITSTIENDFALPPISEFEKHITHRTKAILITNPGNPTGYLYNDDELNLLKELVLKYDLYLFSDEVYREFTYDGEKHKSVLNLDGLEEHAVMLDSISKRFSMCGARIGSIVTKNKRVIDAAMKFAQARLSPPTIGQVAAEAALNEPAEYFEMVFKKYLNRRDLLVSELNKIEGVHCVNPKGAFYTIAKLPIDDSDKFCQWLLSDFSYKNQTIMLAPATGFYASSFLGHDEVRIAYVLNQKDLQNAVECLKEALKIYSGRKQLFA